ncbi:tetratricopeptide repeat protein [Sunxiuqinia sp. sy24]|uniref:tetratricopeptide repeat protein n=1 Tax=Sunxiuqinia sp. sy24 TaxID=3461495 RepID=UPI00404683E2
MEEDSRDFYDNEEIGEAVKRFERMMKANQVDYFDVFEVEGIVDYFLDEGQMTMANQAIENGLKIHPSSITLQIKKAQLLLVDGKVEESLSIIRVAELIEESNSDIYLIKGSALIMQGFVDEAITAYEHAISHNYEEEDELLYNIGITLGQAGEIQKAITFLERAHTFNPKNEQVLYELAYYCDKDNQDDKSILYYNRYLDIDPFNPSVWYNLGITFNRIGQHDKAIEAYDFSITLNDEFEQALFNKANALSNNGQHEEAVECYLEYLKTDKDNDDAYCYLGECYLNLDRYNEALVNYRKAIRLNKNNANAWYGSSLIMWIENNLTESQSLIKKALKLDDTNPDYWLMYGKINHELDLFDQAESAFDMATSLDPDNRECWISYAEMQYDRGLLQQAIDILKKANQIIVDDSNINYRLTAFLLENNEERSATDYFEIALKADFNSYRDLFDYYPQAQQNESIKQLIKEYQSTNF